jgi:hypothetical protein
MTDERPILGGDPDPCLLVPVPAAVAFLLNHDASVTDDPTPAPPPPAGDWVRVRPWHFADTEDRADVTRVEPSDQDAPTGL